ncbi:hypothetical protein ACQSAV_20530, partial [Klebsiella pneumoniae]
KNLFLGDAHTVVDIRQHLANRPQGGLDASVRLAAAGLYPDVSSGKTDN